MSADPAPSKRDVLDEIKRRGGTLATDAPEPLAPVEDDAEAEVERQLVYEKLRAFKGHHDSKRDWSKFMMEIMAFLVAFQMFLLAMVGFGWWDFTAYRWLLPLLLVQNFAQIVGLALVVVKALFDNFKE